MNIRNKIAGTLAAAGIGLSALVGGCNIDKPEYFKETKTTINPHCISVDYKDGEIELRWYNFDLTGFEGQIKGSGEIKYRNEEGELVRIEASSQSNLARAIPTTVYTTSTGTIPLGYNKELADKVNEKWIELCEKLDCVGLSEKQSKRKYRYFDVKL